MKKPASNISILIERDERLQRIYTFHKKLSNGCFGHLFLVTNRLTGKKNALKVEIIVSEQRMTLPKEFQIMRKLEGVKGIPEVYNFGRTEKLMYLELQLLVRDLGSWDEKQNRVPKVCKIGHEMLHILERIHKHNIVHRDLKPQNMMLDKQDQLFLIDFGISKEMSLQSQSKGKLSFVGTPRYASINAHRGRQQTPLDDIQSLMYNLIFMCTRTLPWVSVGGGTNNKLDAILVVKNKTQKSDLCKDLPKCFLDTFEYISKIKIGDPIDYDYLASEFKTFSEKEVRTEIMPPTVETPPKGSLSKSMKVNPRRISIQTNPNLLLVPSNTEVLYSQKTIQVTESQQVLRSLQTMAGEIFDRVIALADSKMDLSKSDLQKSDITKSDISRSDLTKQSQVDDVIQSEKSNKSRSSGVARSGDLGWKDMEELMVNEDTVETKIRALNIKPGCMFYSQQ